MEVGHGLQPSILVTAFLLFIYAHTVIFFTHPVHAILCTSCLQIVCIHIYVYIPVYNTEITRLVSAVRFAWFHVRDRMYKNCCIGLGIDLFRTLCAKQHRWVYYA